MNSTTFRYISMASLGLSMLLYQGPQDLAAQPPEQRTLKPDQEVERGRLFRQLEELRRTGKLDAAAAVAERILESERRAGGEMTAGVAEALSRLAELHELSGNWGQALQRRKETLTIRERIDGKDSWRTADARLAVAFVEKVTRLDASDRTKVQTALGSEEAAAQLDAQGKYEEAERARLAALETYRALLGPEAPEVARVWVRIGRARRVRNDARGAKLAYEQAVAVQRRAVPEGHPLMAISLHELGTLQEGLDELAAAQRSYEQALAIWRAALPEDDPGIALCLMNLGGVQHKLGEHAAARRNFEDALAAYRKALPPDHPDIADCLWDLGILERQLGDYKAARRSHEEALAIRRKALPAGNVRIAESLRDLGNVQYDLNEYAAARQNLEEALAIFCKASPPNQLAIADGLISLGAVCRKLMEFPAANQKFEEAMKLFRNSLPAGHPEIARALNHLGAAQQDLRDYAKAKKSFEESLAILRKSLPEGHTDIALGLNRLGSAQGQLRDYAAAKESFQSALAILRKARPPSQRDIGTSLTFLGHAQMELQEYTAAKKSCEEAVDLCRKSLPPDHPEIAASLYNLGALQNRLREFDAAKASHEEALAIRRKVLPVHHPDIADSLNSLGDVQTDLRDYAAAQKSLQEALAIRRDVLPEDDPSIASVLNDLGCLQHDLREYEAAKEAFGEALAINRRALPPDDPSIASVLINLGNLQRELRQYEAAQRNIEEALAINRQALRPGHLDISLSLESLGAVQAERMKFVEAKKSFVEALAICRKVLPKDDPRIAERLANLGSVQLELRDFAAARKSYGDALASHRKALPTGHPVIAQNLHNLVYLSLGAGIDGETALPRATEATDIYQAEQLQMAVAQAETEQLITAAHSRSSLELWIDATFTTAVDPRAVYDRVVRGKGSVTAQQRWARQARDAADPETRILLDRLRGVSREIFGLSVHDRATDPTTSGGDVAARIRSLCDERSRLERQLIERSAVYRAILARARIGGEHVRAALPLGTVLIDFIEFWHVLSSASAEGKFFEQQQIVAFIVRPEKTGVEAVSLGPSRPLTELIDRWRASYGAGKSPPPNSPDPGTELRTRLWKPLAEHLKGVEVVLVSPDGPLNGLPWAALPGSKPGTFLVHEYAFAVVPVPQLLPELLGARANRTAAPASLVVGNIDFDALVGPDRDAKPENHFPPLPGTKAEAAAVRDMFRAAFAGRPAELLTGKDATEEAFVSRAPNCSHLLIATHGFFVPDPERRESVGPGQFRSLEAMLFRRDLVTTNPALRSGLVFAGANYAPVGYRNSFLTALEASELDLARVDLAVLSACETGLGTIVGGEGVLGLQRAFQLAGARTAVTSLWKVPDAATQAIMTRFHRNLWEKKMGTLEALREAQIWLIAEGPKHPELNLRGGLERPDSKREAGDRVSPFYWAAFVLSGDWR